MDVTTLIPAFKPQFLLQLLKALQHQTFRPARVIISDDNPEQPFVAAMREIEATPLARELNVTVVVGPRQGFLKNIHKLLDTWSEQTELFHILCDDDLIYPDFYRWHVAAQGAGFPCTVSRRWSADELGQPLSMLHEPNEVRGSAQALMSVSAQQLIPSVVPTVNNWLGEVSNVVMHRELAHLYRDLSFAGIPYDGLDDIGTFLRASTLKPLGLITHFLGAFRQHAEQNTANQRRRIIKLGHVAWIALALSSQRGGYVTLEQAKQCIATVAHHTLRKYADEPDMGELCAAIAPLGQGDTSARAIEVFLECWARYVHGGAPAASAHTEQK